ncbi:hypothetical protein GCM10009779_12570 [Polymorphospora rubra]|uniref:Uncharacterized protein n=1 Tax=Polymorphospora rubra TaxID=338584 RepID=A0A810N6C0_9ACTN|nr:hypothetical protein Prubr_59770 [Polymorphospora rubra]
MRTKSGRPGGPSPECRVLKSHGATVDRLLNRTGPARGGGPGRAEMIRPPRTHPVHPLDDTV